LLVDGDGERQHKQKRRHADEYERATINVHSDFIEAEKLVEPKVGQQVKAR
jgi:hypothetical protein